MLHWEQLGPRDRELQEHKGEWWAKTDKRTAYNIHAQRGHQQDSTSIPWDNIEHEPVHRIDAKSQQGAQVLMWCDR